MVKLGLFARVFSGIRIVGARVSQSEQTNSGAGPGSGHEGGGGEEPFRGPDSNFERNTKRHKNLRQQRPLKATNVFLPTARECLGQSLHFLWLMCRDALNVGLCMLANLALIHRAGPYPNVSPRFARFAVEHKAQFARSRGFQSMSCCIYTRQVTEVFTAVGRHVLSPGCAIPIVLPSPHTNADQLDCQEGDQTQKQSTLHSNRAAT